MGVDREREDWEMKREKEKKRLREGKGTRAGQMWPEYNARRSFLTKP